MFLKSNTYALLIAFLFFFTVSAKEYTISSVSELNSLSLLPCDVVIWTNGTYSNININFTGNGKSGSPIVLRAETPGGVIFTGSSEMNIWGDYLIVDGFYWNGGVGTNNHVEFRKGGSGNLFATNTIFRNCAFNNLVTTGDDKSRWVVLYGYNNTVENCSFMNKNSTGVYVLVELSYQTTGITGHILKNNYFYNVFAKDGRGNSGDSEGIRIGSSSKQTINAGVLVEGNYFYKVDGENEIISNKSKGNTYRNNTFRNCRGALVLRHGANALVEGNYFLGENKAKSGGIRVIDQGHVIINNYMQGLNSNSSSYNNGITMMGGNASSGGTSNGYQNVDNVLIAFNTIYDSSGMIYFNAEKGSYNATGTFANNLIYSTKGTIIAGDISKIGTRMNYTGNVFGGSTIGITNAGITNANANFSASGEISKPSSTGVAANVAAGSYTNVIYDIAGLTRPATLKDVGAHEVSGGSGMASNPNPIANSAVGVSVGACYLTFDGSASSSACVPIVYGQSCMPIAVTGVSVSPKTASIFVADTQQLTATIAPVNATNSTITWSTSDVAIATVSASGLVTAVKNGVATITVTTADGSKTDTATITVLKPLSPPNCIKGKNLVLGATVVSFTSEQATNPAANAIDGDTDTRWSAENFPQSIVLDLGAGYNIDATTFHSYNNRDYQYLIEGSNTSATAGFTTLVDRKANTTASSVFNDTFNLKVARYIKLTVTGAATYTGPWVSVSDLEIICAGIVLSTPEHIITEEATLFPNPFNNEIYLKIPSGLRNKSAEIQLVDIMGKIIKRQKITTETIAIKFDTPISEGLYFLQILNSKKQVIQSKKVIKN